jgi:ssDNA-binding Zn-finger/Zn-ribbon topoisomerase 1
MDTEFKVDWGEDDPMFGPTLACPGCGKSTFVIHRGIMNESEVEAGVPPREIAECFNCHIQTYASALKTKYTSNDFPAIGAIKLYYCYECTVCGRLYENKVNAVAQCYKHPEATLKTMFMPY